MYVFNFGGCDLDRVENYKYLGLILTEHFDYNTMVNMIVHAANRALGLLIAKSKVKGGMSFDCFTKLL